MVCNVSGSGRHPGGGATAGWGGTRSSPWLPSLPWSSVLTTVLGPLERIGLRAPVRALAEQAA